MLLLAMVSQGRNVRAEPTLGVVFPPKPALVYLFLFFFSLRNFVLKSFRGRHGLASAVGPHVIFEGANHMCTNACTAWEHLLQLAARLVQPSVAVRCQITLPVIRVWALILSADSISYNVLTRAAYGVCDIVGPALVVITSNYIQISRASILFLRSA